MVIFTLGDLEAEHTNIFLYTCELVSFVNANGIYLRGTAATEPACFASEGLAKVKALNSCGVVVQGGEAWLGVNLEKV